MIVWGTKSKVIPGPAMEMSPCPSCENSKFNTFGILKYMHVYWIPFVTKGRIPGIECQHCKRTLVGNELPNDVAKQIKATVFTKKAVYSKCIGIILALFLILAGVTHGVQHSQDETVYLAQPAVHDVYLVDFSKIFNGIDTKYKYGAMRVLSVSGDTIEVQVSKMGYKRTKGVRSDIRWGKTDKASYYDTKTEHFSLDELKKLKENGAIYSIERD